MIPTHYAGSKSFDNPAKQLGSDKETTCAKYKCKHCPWFASADPRRMARHFLPAVPAEFWRLPDERLEPRGVDPCPNAPRAVIDGLRELGCQEFVKHKAIEDGTDSATLMCCYSKKKMTSAKKSKSSASMDGPPETGYSLPTTGIDDKSRYAVAAEDSNDASRLTITRGSVSGGRDRRPFRRERVFPQNH